MHALRDPPGHPDGDGGGEGDDVVLPISPNRISLKTTFESAAFFSSFDGSPEPLAQGPRFAPGAVEPTGCVASSQAICA